MASGGVSGGGGGDSGGGDGDSDNLTLISASITPAAAATVEEVPEAAAESSEEVPVATIPTSSVSSAEEDDDTPTTASLPPPAQNNNASSWAKHLAPEEQTAAPAAPPVTAPAAAPASTPHVAPAAADAAPEDNGQSKKSGLPSSNFIMQQASIIASQAGTALSYGMRQAQASTSSASKSAGEAIEKAGGPVLKKATAQANVAYAEAKLASRVVRAKTGIDSKVARASEPITKTARPMMDGLMRRFGFRKSKESEVLQEEADKEVYPVEREGMRELIDEFAVGKTHLERMLKKFEQFYAARRSLAEASSDVSMALAEHGVRRTDACSAAERAISDAHRKLASIAKDLCDVDENRVLESLRTHIRIAEADAYESVADYEGVRNELTLLKESMDDAAASRLRAANSNDPLVSGKAILPVNVPPRASEEGAAASASDEGTHTRVGQAAEEMRAHLEKKFDKMGELVYSKLTLLLSKRRADYVTWLSFHAKSMGMDYREGVRSCDDLDKSVKGAIEEETRRATEALGALSMPKDVSVPALPHAASGGGSLPQKVSD